MKVGQIGDRVRLSRSYKRALCESYRQDMSDADCILHRDEVGVLEYVSEPHEDLWGRVRWPDGSLYNYGGSCLTIVVG